MDEDLVQMLTACRSKFRALKSHLNIVVGEASGTSKLDF